MKKGLKLGAASLAMLLVFGAAGCGCSKDAETATAYGLVHKSYLGVATVTHKGSDVTKVVFDEVMLPSSWAQIGEGTTAATLGVKTGTFTTAVTSADLSTVGENTPVAKYIKIGNVVFAASDKDYSLGGTVVADYQSGKFTNGVFAKDGVSASDSKIDSLYAYIQTEVGGKWYHEEMKAGNYDILSAAGNPLGLTYADGKGTAALKSTNGYGTQEGHKFAWADNMSAMADYIVEKDNLDSLDIFDYSKSYTVESKKYFGTSDSDVVTGATLNDFYDYMLLAQSAYKK